MVDAVLSIGLLLVVAKIAEGVFARLGLNSIIAYTATGVLLGPVAGIVEPTEESALFLGVGVFVFFFLIGLDEVDISGFVATIRGRFFLAATVSVIVPLAASLGVTLTVLDLPFTTALALSGVLALSSLGIVAKVLADEGHLKEPLGLEIFTTVIIAELIALLIVGFTISETGHDDPPGVGQLPILLGQIIGFAVVAWVLSAQILPPVIILLQRFLSVPQLPFGLLLGGLFLMVVAAHEIGLHGSIGALLFGAALSGMPHRVRLDIMPGLRSTTEGLFVPLFFASAGLSVDLSFTELSAGTIAAVVAVAVLGKAAGAFAGPFAARLDTPFALGMGLMAKGVAEIALLLVLFETGAISQALFSLLVIIMFGFILVTPTAMSFAINRAKASDDPVMPEAATPSYARYALDTITVADILDTSRTYPDSDLSVLSFTEQWIVPHQHDYVVIDEGAVAGVASLTRLRFLPKRTWAKARVRALMRRRVPAAYPDETIDDVLERMTDHALSVIPVLDRKSGRFLGSVTSQDILGLIMQGKPAAH